MKSIRWCWQPKPRSSVSVVFLLRGRCRGALSKPLLASKTSTAGAPLSLNDIIAFESDLPSLVVQEAPPDRRVEELIDRAARVLREVNNVLTEDADEAEGPSPRRQQQEQQQQAPAVTLLATRSGPGVPFNSEMSSGSSGSHLSRAMFGGSAQVSEREATLTRQALQKTLQGSPSNSLEASSGDDVHAPSSAADEDTQERPAWAQALFASSAGSPSAPSSSSTATSGSAGNRSDEPTGLGVRSNTAQSSAPAPSRYDTSDRTAVPGPLPTSDSSSAGLRPQQTPPQLQLQPAPTARRPLAAWAPLAFAEVDLSVPTELVLKSEAAMFAEAARSAVLPPLQSVVDLTAAVRPPTRGLDLDLGTGTTAAAQQDEQQAAVSAAVTVSEAEVVQGGALGRRLADGAGRLADGTRFEKLSGTDTGPDGYVKRWEVLRGVTGDGQVQWEECWWQASNRYGLRELGAFKKGTTESGAAWVEEWKELLYTHSTNLRLAVERTAHKWARDENSDEWEEKWGECFEEAGRVHKWADKWAKAGCNVWHERWGEDYDGKGACQKWTDKWAERLLPDGGQEQWGDKWTETFGHGKGTKHGEVWSSSSGGSRYNRWWNEEHYGDSRVRKWGNSNSGEYWDTVEHMDTYYNPVPHFGFQHAVGHSPQLWAVTLPTPDEADDGSHDDDDGLGVGVGRL